MTTYSSTVSTTAIHTTATTTTSQSLPPGVIWMGSGWAVNNYIGSTWNAPLVNDDAGIDVVVRCFGSGCSPGCYSCGTLGWEIYNASTGGSIYGNSNPANMSQVLRYGNGLRTGGSYYVEVTASVQWQILVEQYNGDTTTTSSTTSASSTTATSMTTTSTTAATSTTASTSTTQSGSTPTSTSVQCPASITTASSFTCTAYVNPESATGVVTFRTQSAGSITMYHHCTLSGGSCTDTFTYNGDVGGGSTVTITAAYDGDSTHAPSTSPSVVIQVEGLSTTTTTTTSAPAFRYYTVSITYVVTNSTICNPYPLVQCTWSGTISWPNGIGYSNYVIGPTNGGATYNVNYPQGLVGQPGNPITWSLSMNTPPSQSVLTLTVTDANGNVVLQQSTASSNTTDISGSYQP